MRVLILALVFFSIIRNGISQDATTYYSPPSPNAYSLLRNANVPVNEYTGTANASLPITQLKTRQGPIPVSLTYNTAGIKVQDVASWAGLGWTLNAGGVITRILRGLPDENANGFCGTNNVGEKAYLTPGPAYIGNVGRGIWDGEPDIFYYNFLGYTGKFVLDETGSVVQLPASNLKIKPAICPLGSGQWEVTDPNGVVYIFGGTDDSKESTNTKLSTSSGSGTTYISSWYLSKIKRGIGTDQTVNGNDITFDYSTSGSASYSYYTQSGSTKIASDGSNFGPSCSGDAVVTTDQNIEITIANPRYLSTITSSFGSITFVRGSERLDLPGTYSLSYILVLDPSGNFVEHYKLQYSYFTSDACSTTLCKRLKLDRVEKIGINGPTLVLYQLAYNELNLPSRDSHAVDHWGYYNSNTFAGKLPYFDDTGNYCGRIHDGADKSGDPLKSQANILTHIYNSTGGYTKFEYSGHEYLDGTTKTAGGARILSVSQCADGSCVQTNYSYNKFGTSNTSGLIAGLPVYHYRTVITNIFPPFGWTSSTYLERHSQSLVNLFDINGYHIGYSNVQITIPGESYSRLYFTNFEVDNSDSPPRDHRDILPTQYKYQYWNNTIDDGSDDTGTVGETISGNAYPFTPATSLSDERGILRIREIYRENNNLLSTETFTPNFTLPDVKRIKAYKAGLTHISQLARHYNVGTYEIVSKPYTLTQTVQTTNDYSSGAAVSTTNVNEFTYNAFYLPKTTTSYNTAYPSLKRTNKKIYVMDLNYSGAPLPDANADAILHLKNTYHVATVIEDINFLESKGETKVISAAHTKFEKRGTGTETFAVPTAFLTLNQTLNYSAGTGKFMDCYIDAATGILQSDSRLKVSKQFVEYDNSVGLLLNEKGNDGISRLYEWNSSFNKNYVTRVVLNPNNPASGSPDWQHATSYLHQPLVGITSITDLSGRTATFEYDYFGRVKLGRDHAGNILNRYRYHNVTQNDDFTNAINVSTKRVTGVSLVISSNDTPSGYGQDEYSWSFGDGSTGTGMTNNHSYSSAGTYTISLNKKGKERAPLTTTKTIVIAPPPSPSICANGIVRYDICGVVSTVYGACGSASTTTLTASVSGGCSGPMTYSWSYQVNGGSSQPLGTGTSVTAPSAFNNRIQGNYLITLTVTDSCEYDSTITFLLANINSSNC